MKNLESEFIPYNLALRMKALSYDKTCLAGYELDIVNDGKPELIFPNVIKQFDEEDEIFEDPITTYPRLFTIKNDVVLAPTWRAAFKWFREKYDLCLVIKPIDDKKLNLGYSLLKNGLVIRAYTTYEKAEIACLEQLIEIVEQKQLKND
jgi:hypothetical protein